jgi:antitoxin component YwqK of YwqJK toxin-antitoxin module
MPFGTPMGMPGTSEQLLSNQITHQLDAGHDFANYIPQVKRIAHQFQGGHRAAGQLTSGLADGIWTYWFPNGRLDCEGEYLKGAKVGLWTFWYPGGSLDCMGEYRDDIEDGPWTSWYTNGQKQEDGVFQAGRKIGLWKYWTEDGETVSEVDYGMASTRIELATMGR